jgi:hypothetical protein
MTEFNPGDRVAVYDRGTDTFQPAIVVALEIKPGVIGDPYDKPGFVVRYDNGCECWVRASNVYSPRGNVNDLYADAKTCECAALIEEIDSGDGYTYWAHVKRMRIRYDHAAVPVGPATDDEIRV